MRKKFNNENIKRVKSGPGTYELYKKRAKKPTYVGSSNNLKLRLKQHKKQKFYTFEVKHTKRTSDARRLEKKLIRKHKPVRNKIKYG